jgi:drug/metabolite transporter (DMT)-like permease
VTKQIEAPPTIRLFSILAIGLICVSSGSILVRLSQEAPSLTIAFFRMFWASLLLSPLFLWSRSGITISSWPLQILTGCALALHFAFWIASLRFTSVAVSVLLVNTSPAVVAAFSFFFLGERLTVRGLLGLLLSFLGGAVLVWNDLNQLGDWRGSVLALLGAAMLAVYLLVGRKVRQSASLIGYIFPTYLLAALVLAGIVFFGSAPISGFSWRTYCFLFLLGLIPQCLGHTCYNWALRYLSATLISIIILGEPVLATLMAWWILGETIGQTIVFGAALVGVGIFTVSRWGGVRATVIDESQTETPALERQKRPRRKRYC